MRFVYYLVSILGSLLLYSLSLIWPPALYGFLILGPYIVIGFFDIINKKRTILRNYPVIGHLRYMMEYIRPEIQQYYIETDEDGRPFSREIRSLVYRRAKGIRDTIGFGTKQEITEPGYHFSHHSLHAKHPPKESARVTIGGPDCKQPYSASRLNISAMSYGSLSPNALRALNIGAAKGGFAHNTGEGAISSYHHEGGADLIWQIGTGYFGCRTKEGRFDAELFAVKSKQENVKMIEIKLSQGAKPAHGGILPGAKVTKEIAEIRGLEEGQDAISPPCHPEFSTPIELLEFVAKLRELSEGKPVGFKLCLGKRAEFMGICKAMLETSIYPDFITIDGAEGGTGAAPLSYANRLGTPVNEAVNFVNNCLVGIGARDRIRIIASGKVATGYDLIMKLALGADACNSARAMMFALGCIQSLACNTNRCPTGVATQNKHRWVALDVRDKSKRVENFHRSTMESFLELLGAMGKMLPEELSPHDIRRYTDSTTSKNYQDIYPQLEEGELLGSDINPYYNYHWQRASSGKFEVDER